MSELGRLFFEAIGGEGALVWALRLLMVAAAGALLLGWVLRCRYRREKLRLWWLILRSYCPPWLGMVRRLSRQEMRPRELAPGERWSEAEIRICDKFSDLHRSSGILSPDLYNSARSYLRKVGEAGRSELGWRWLGIVLLFFAEATIMAKVISGYTLPGASEAVQWNAALLIGGLLTLVLLILTHLSGRELHLRGLVKLARKEWRERKNREDSIRPPDLRYIEIDEDRYDDSHPIYHQMARRLEGNAKFMPGVSWRTVFCVAFILFLTGAGYTIRLASYEQERRDYEQLRISEAREVAGGGLIEDSPGDLLAAAPLAAPDALDAAAASAQPPDLWAHRVTYGVLGVLFLALQWIAIWLARRYGFSGIHSAAASSITSRFTTIDDYRDWIQAHRNAIARRASGALDKLQELQQRREIHEGIGQDSEGRLAPRAQRTFARYIALLESPEQPVQPVQPVQPAQSAPASEVQPAAASHTAGIPAAGAADAAPAPATPAAPAAAPPVTAPPAAEHAAAGAQPAASQAAEAEQPAAARLTVVEEPVRRGSGGGAE